MSGDIAMSVRPKYDQLIELLDTLVNWQKFGTFLPGIKSEHIQVIEHDIRGTDLQKAALFSKWLSIHPEASWQDVLFALEKSQEYTLASRVYQQLNTTSLTAFTTFQGIKTFLVKMILLHIGPQKIVKTVMLESKEEEKQVKITLVSLDRNFSLLMVAVRSSLDHKLQHQQLVLVDFIRWIEHRMKWVGQLSSIVDLDEIFLKLHPYFDFLDCCLIVDMSEEFLNDEFFNKDKKSLVSELKEHIDKAESFRCSSTVKELKDKLKTVYSPHLTDLANMPQIQIELHNPWNEAAIEGLYLLIQHLLPHRTKQSILKYIEIETGSVRIKYIVHESKADVLIAYAQDKLQFMRLIGIFGLIINGEPILDEDENMNFTFESALLKAANIGHNEAVQFFVKLRGDIDHCDEEGITALMIASNSGHEQIVQSLVSVGTNVNIQDNEGWTALMLASYYGYTQVIKDLLKEHADTNIQNQNGWTALVMASQNGHVQVVEQLLKEHADINIQSNDGWTALMMASQNGRTQVVEQLLKEHADINIQTNKGLSALMLASRNGDSQVVEQLLKEHADVNAQNNKGVTSLMITSNTQIVEQLLKEDADVNIQSNDGWTALMMASQNGLTQVVEQLLKEHADINIQTNKGVSALMLASRNGDSQVVEQLLKEHADVNAQNNKGVTSLMITSNTQVVEQLLKEDADVNIQTKNGWTALMIASANGHTQIVKLLTKELVDIDAQKKNGRTALMLACRYGHVEVAECLLQSFADPHIIAYDGSTAFSLAAYSGNRDLVNMLLDKAEPTTDEIEKAVVLSCYGGHPILIIFLSNKLPHLTYDQRELLDSCIKGDLAIVITKTLDRPDTPLVLGLTPLMVASSCGHVDIVDALIQAGADVNKQESHLGLTPLFFAVKGGQSSLIVETLLIYGASPNVVATTNKTPLDVAISVSETFEMDGISELLIKYGGQTLQSQRRNESESKSLFLAFDELKAITTLQTTDEITDRKPFKDKDDTIKRKPKQEISSFSSFIDLFT